MFRSEWVWLIAISSCGGAISIKTAHSTPIYDHIFLNSNNQTSVVILTARLLRSNLFDCFVLLIDKSIDRNPKNRCPIYSLNWLSMRNWYECHSTTAQLIAVFYYPNPHHLLCGVCHIIVCTICHLVSRVICGIAIRDIPRLFIWIESNLM